MTVNMETMFFSQFMSPTLLGVPLMMFAMIFPYMMIFHPYVRWFNNYFLIIQNWFIANFLKQIFQPMNFKGHKWAMLLSALLLYLITLNMLGLLPYTFTPTTQLSLNMALAFPLWFATVLTGFRSNFTTALSHLLPSGTPALLAPMLIITETASLFIRPIALAVRLTANLTAGHLLIHLTSMGVFLLTYLSPTTAIIVLTLLTLLSMMEVAIAMIQAYVFVLLLSLYLQENLY